MSEATYPVLVLHPVVDSHYRWVGVRVQGLAAAHAGAEGPLQRLFDEFGLADALDGLPCMLPAEVIEVFDHAAFPEGPQLLPDTGSSVPLVQPPTSHGGPTMTVLLKLLGQLTSDAETRDIEATLKQDPQLSVQLLRLVNSVAFAPSARITSFAQAINLLGRRQLQRWLQLLLYARRQSGEQGNPLLASAALRAAMMEGLCQLAGGSRDEQDQAFMVGMFSLLEAIFSQPLAEIIDSLRLAGEVTAALLRRDGSLGRLLSLVEAAEQGVEATLPAVAHCGVDPAGWAGVQVRALKWAFQVSREA